MGQSQKLHTRWVKEAHDNEGPSPTWRVCGQGDIFGVRTSGAVRIGGVDTARCGALAHNALMCVCEGDFRRAHLDVRNGSSLGVAAALTIELLNALNPR